MAKVRILEANLYDYSNDCTFYIGKIYKVQIKIFNLFWFTIKEFNDPNSDYNRICAEELYDKINERC